MVRELGTIKHVALYLRISQEKKGENVETLSNHRSILTEFALRNNFTYEEYSEVLSGGKSDIGDRPQLLRLLKDIEKFDGIVVMELSRISRNGLISETVLQYCVDYDKPIITPEKVYDLANDQNDVLTYKFGALIASNEHAVIGKRSKDNKIAMSKVGLHVSGNTPYGFRRSSQTKKLEIYEPEAQVVRYIFQLHGEGLGVRRIVDILNGEGYKPTRSEAFQLPTVRRIIKNPAYKGTVVFQDRKRIKENGKYVFKVLNSYLTENAHPSIISSEQWERANRDREERADKAKLIREKPSKSIGVTMLKDLVFCGVCGRKMAFRVEKYGAHSLKPCEFLLPNSPEKCMNSGLKLDYLEEEIISELRNYKELLQEELKLLEQSDVSNIEKEMGARLAHLEKEILDNQKEQRNLINLAVTGIFSHDELRIKKQELIDRQELLEANKNKLMDQMNAINPVSHVERISKIIHLLDTFEELPPDKRNESLKQFMKKIRYYRVMPEDIRALTTRNILRREFPFTIEVEYF